MFDSRRKIRIVNTMKTSLECILFAGLVPWAGLLPLGAQPVITTNLPASQSNLLGSSITLSVAVSGAGPFSYQWQFNSNNLPNRNGLIADIAGSSSGSSFSGDGGPATSSHLNHPYSVCADLWGNVYIADTSNKRIRKVDSNGIISTVAGTGVSGIFTNGIMATNANLSSPVAVTADAWGNFFIADNGSNRICKVDTNGIITTLAG